MSAYLEEMFTSTFFFVNYFVVIFIFSTAVTHSFIDLVRLSSLPKFAFTHFFEYCNHTFNSFFDDMPGWVER